MAHIVIHRGPDGEAAHHQVDELAEAIAWVERLRNDHGVEDARIYRLEEVAFQFRPYFRVEVDERRPLDLRDGAGGADVLDDGATPAADPGVGEAEAGMAAEVDRGGARRGLFGR